MRIHSGAPAPARRGWLTANLLAQLAFGLLAMTICLPSMQDWPATFRTSQASVQLTFSGYIAAYGGMQLVYGPLSDRIGRKPVLMLGLAVAFLGSVLAAAAPNLALLTAARVLQGAGTAAGMVVGRALVQDLFSGADRTRIMALVGMTMGLVPPTATLFGGQLHVRLGWQANFVVLAAAAALLFIAAWRGLPSGRPASAAAPAGWSQPFRSYARLAREPAFVWHVLLLTAIAGTFFSFLGGAPLVLANYGVPPDRIGLYIMSPPLAYIAGNLLTSRLIRVRSDTYIMMLGQAITLTSVVLMLGVGLAGAKTPLALALPLLLLGIGHGLQVPPALAGTVGLLPALAGSAAAATGLMQQLGGALGGYLVGLVPHNGQVNLALQMLAWAGCALAAQFALKRVHRPTAG